MLHRVPGAYTESSLLSVMSDTYVRDFQLAANQNDKGMAFDTIERARGRTVADILMSRSNDSPSATSDSTLAD